MIEQETRALLLRAVDYGEADKVCTFITPTRGKITAFARGARGSKKRFRGGLDAFVELEIGLRQRTPNAMATLTRSEAVRAFSSLGSDLARMASGSYALELTGRALEDEQGADLYPTVVRFLGWLANEKDGIHRIEAGLLRYQLLLLHELGALPDLHRCARSAEPLDDEAGARWLPDVGIVTPASRHAGEAAADLPPGTLLWLRGAANGQFPDVDAPAIRASLRQGMLFVWRHLGGRDVKSFGFYDQSVR